MEMNFIHQPLDIEKQIGQNLVFSGLFFKKYLYVVVPIGLDLWFT